GLRHRAHTIGADRAGAHAQPCAPARRFAGNPVARPACMRMRIAGRYDALLLAGLAIATLFLFGSGIQYLLDAAREVERRQGIALLPALVVLSVAFLFQQNMKRQSANAQALAHAAEAAQAQARTRELETIVACGRSLARALTVDALREVLWRHVPQLVGARD